MATKSWTGDNKRYVRENLTARPGRKYHSILDVPGNQCLSTLYWFHVGQIGKRTNVIAVDSDKAVCEIIQNTLQGLGFRSLRVCNGVLQSQLFECELDFVNLDLCAPLRKDTLEWLTTVKFEDGADLSLNMQVPFRGPGNPDFRLGLEQTFDTRKGREVIDTLLTDHPVLVGASADSVRVVAAIATTLSDYDFEIQEPFIYDDRAKDQNATDMRVCNFWNIRKSLAARPAFQELYLGDVPYKSMGKLRTSEDDYHSKGLPYLTAAAGVPVEIEPISIVPTLVELDYSFEWVKWL